MTNEQLHKLLEQQLTINATVQVALLELFKLVPQPRAEQAQPFFEKIAELAERNTKLIREASGLTRKGLLDV